MRTALRALGGAAVLSAAAVAAASLQPEPTLVDRALPLVVVAIWGLGWLTHRGLLRDVVVLLVPVTIGIEIAVPDAGLRVFLVGCAFAVAAVVHLSQLPVRWSPSEILTALFIVTPTRLTEPSPGPLLVQSLFIIGSIGLWQVVRRRTHPWVAAGVILLLAVSIPGHSAKLALVPWVLVAALWGIRRDGWVEKAVVAAMALAVARWLGATIILIMVVEAIVRSARRAPRSAVFVPALSAIPANSSRVVVPALFFPALLSRIDAALPVVAATMLALFLRPSLGPAVVVTGLVLACSQVPCRSPVRENDALALPSLVVAGLILMFFPWSGAIVARPPSLFPLTTLLVVAALSLLPPVFRRYSGLVGLMLFLSAALVVARPGVEVREIGRALAAGESTVIELPRDREPVEIRIAGANVADEGAGTLLGTVELLDSGGNGFSRPVRIGEVADWGAFRPEMVLGTWNPRPELPVKVEGYGIRSWVRGTGRIPIDGSIGPRWLVITGSDRLASNQQLIIEEVVVR